MNLTSNELEELIIGLKHRYYQEHTDKIMIDELAGKLSDYGKKRFGWTSEVWDQHKQNRVKVIIKTI
jgi:hypothetical protein